MKSNTIKILYRVLFHKGYSPDDLSLTTGVLGLLEVLSKLDQEDQSIKLSQIYLKTILKNKLTPQSPIELLYYTSYFMEFDNKFVTAMNLQLLAKSSNKSIRDYAKKFLRKDRSQDLSKLMILESDNLITYIRDGLYNS